MAPHTHTPPPGSHHQSHRPHHPQHPHTHGGIRPAVPDMPRRRGNSVIIPAIPAIPQFQHLQQQQLQHHQYLQHPQQQAGYQNYPMHHYSPQHLQHHQQMQMHTRIQRQAPPPPQPPPPPPPMPPTPTQVEEPLYIPPPPASATPTPTTPTLSENTPLEPATLAPRPHFRPPLPWYSAPGPFPPRRRRVARIPLPAPKSEPPASAPPPPPPPAQEPEKPSAATSVTGVPTPPMSAAPSEVDSTHPTTPSSTAPPSVSATILHKSASVPLAVPAVPLVTPKVRGPPPAVPPLKVAPKEESSDGIASLDGAAQSSQPAPKEAAPAAEKPVGNETPEKTTEKATENISEKPAERPKSNLWSDLLKSSQSKTPAGISAGHKAVNGSYGTLAEALKAFQILHGDVISVPFLEPRGLVNTGNMCFMNAILQMLLFCGPFYYFLERVSTGARSFKDNTPLIEMMIMFAREFRVITRDSSAKIKSEDLEAFGESFAPEFVYETIRKLKRFSHMRRGHQQDAEEFLGFLLDGLHEEAVEVMNKNPTPTVITNGDDADAKESEWMEVGFKQKAATTRTTETPESPISKIFGGKFRSEFRVPGLPTSVTTEPYTPLQLDIQAPDVISVIDALKHLTIPEKLQGDFKSPKGPNVTATKQVFIDTLPPVLILHLKRFQYDNTGGVQKIWKKIAYPLELDIPSEAMSPRKRQGQRPRYRLIGVVYHHGSSAQGGHYTVDVLRQDAKSWLRFDDTVMKRVGGVEVTVDVKELGKDGPDADGIWGGMANGAGRKDDKQAYILFYQRI